MRFTAMTVLAMAIAGKKVGHQTPAIMFEYSSETWRPQSADGGWIPIQSYETRPPADAPCGPDTTSFLTDTEGSYLRVAAYQGPATYRARWIKFDGTSEYGVTVPVRALEPTTG